jgi:two-component system response regulator YesN
MLLLRIFNCYGVIRMKVFIVDDDKYTRLGIREMIHWEDLKLTYSGDASNGTEALNAIQFIQPHIVISDASMPVMNGLELANQLYEHYPFIKVIIVSGYNDFDFVKRALKSHVVDYILKPIDEEELHDALIKAIKGIHGVEDEREQTNKTWSYPLELENAIVQALQLGEQTKLRFSVELFFRKLIDAKIGLSEAKLWISHLIIQTFKSYNEPIYDEHARKGLRLSELIFTESSLIVIQQKVIFFFISFVTHIHNQKNESHTYSIHLAKTFIDNHYSENLNLKTLAHSFHMSASQFSQHFKQTTGQNFIHYVTNLRIEQSKRQLKDTTWTVDKIASQVGFEDPGYFRKIFKRYVGMTPLEYRR